MVHPHGFLLSPDLRLGFHHQSVPNPCVVCGVQWTRHTPTDHWLTWRSSQSSRQLFGFAPTPNKMFEPLFGLTATDCTGLTNPQTMF